MSKYISHAMSKINRKAKAPKVRTQTTESIMAADDVHRVAQRQPQLYKINSVPVAPRMRLMGPGGLA